MTRSTPGARARRQSGFTLLELVVGLTMSLAIAGVAMSTLLTVQGTQREAQLRNAATRDALYMLDMVGGDLAYAGVGVPYGTNLDGLAGRMRPVVRYATSKQLAFIGDLPLPNSELNGLAQLVDIKGDRDDEVAVASEVSLCAPSSGGGGGSYVCDTTKNSLLNLPAGVADCSSSQSASTCPWAMGKWAPLQSPNDGDAFQLLLLTTPKGDWVWRRQPFEGGVPKDANIGSMRGVHFEHDFPVRGGHEISDADFVTSPIGASTISTLDRVFYSYEVGETGEVCADGRKKCQLARRHCWGQALNPTSAGFPAPGTTGLQSSVTPAGCTAPQEGTVWEPVANNITDLVFRYFDKDGVEIASPVPVADLSRIASIELFFVVERKTADTFALELRQPVSRRWFLESGDAWGTGGRK